ncbi:amidohydrolase [Novosphingobium sp. 9]|uniref:amidohydrolase n=1 Tax=Novosphingobium sp. 9 TaxID=2025349 RepID=UPI0021B4E674|nr:amidohydrolase [Novosphingobium sp. 9]
MIDRRRMLAGTGLLAGTAAAMSNAAWAAAGRALAAERVLDVAYINARVWTANPLQPRTDAIGLAGNRIVALGQDAVRAAIGKGTRVVDLQGAFVSPGFIDNHTHFMIASTTLSQPDLLSSKDRADFVSRLGKVAHERPGKWILGGSWDEQRLGGGLPDKSWIDAATGDTPVAVPRTDLHMYLCNSAALRLAGITRNTPDVPGGEIGRDASGEPNGILKDNAKQLVERVIPQPTDAERDATMREGISWALARGFTQVHTPEPFDWVTFDTARRVRAKGETDLRFLCMVPARDWEKLAAIIAKEGKGDEWVRWGAVKALADGSLGSRTARFHQPYTDAPGVYGNWVTQPDELRAQVFGADKAGLQVAIHAIGDAANDLALDVFAETEARNGPRDRRGRIEHAQHLTAAALPRFAAQKVIASVQPYHAIDDGRWAVDRIGEERLERTYAFGSLLETGATVTFGSDWPVAPLDARQGIYAAVTRETIDGKNPQGWLPDQKISVEQALTCYTRNNAFAGFQERDHGRIAPGFIADLTVLGADPFETEPNAIPDIEILRTLVDGKERYTA